jgi:lysozyme family protein
MSYAYQALAPDYASLLPKMVIDADKLRMFESVAYRVIQLGDAHDAEWSAVEAETAVPRLWGMASFEREADSDYRDSPAQGDPWNRVSHNVPAGRGPFPNWGAACVDAYRIDHLQLVGKSGWTWTRACYEGEIFNGMGYRAHGYHSSYLWAGCNIYVPVSKYTGDGRFTPGYRDTQPGLIPLMFTMLRLKPSLALVDAFPSPMLNALVHNAPPPAPVPDAMSLHSTSALQKRLGLDVDGNYGRLTKRAVANFQKAHGLTVDGIAGDATWAVLDKMAAA